MARFFPKASLTTESQSQNISFDESSSTNATFSTLTDPDGNGVNYRLAKFLSNGQLVINNGGYAEILLCGGGGGAGGYGGEATGGSGGAGGMVETTTYLDAGTYSIVVGQGGNGVKYATRGDNGTDTTVSIDGSAILTAKGGGGAGWGDVTPSQGGSGGGAGGGGGATGGAGALAPTISFTIQGYSGHSGGSGSGWPPSGGGGGAGGPGATSGVGGVGRTSRITGEDIVYCEGGRGTHGTPSSHDGLGYGGHTHESGYGTKSGSDGGVYIRIVSS